MNSEDKLSFCSKLHGANVFQEVINQSALIEIKSSGLWFIWSNNRKDSATIWEKLDRSFCNESWFSLYLDSIVHCVSIAAFNHAPLLMDTFKKQTYSKYNFRFQNAWISHLSCSKVVDLAWSKPQQGSLSLQLLSRLNETKSHLKYWVKKVSGSFQNNIKAARRDAIIISIVCPQLTVEN